MREVAARRADGRIEKVGAIHESPADPHLRRASLGGSQYKKGRGTRPLRMEQLYPIHLSAVVIVTARAIHESPLRKEQPYPIHPPAVIIVGFPRTL